MMCLEMVVRADMKKVISQTPITDPTNGKNCFTGDIISLVVLLVLTHLEENSSYFRRKHHPKDTNKLAL